MSTLAMEAALAHGCPHHDAPPGQWCFTDPRAVCGYRTRIGLTYPVRPMSEEKWRDRLGDFRDPKPA